MVKWTENINGEPYTSRGVRTVRGRVLGNTAIVIWKGTGYLAYIVANRVGYDGKTASDRNSYRRMAQFCREMEKRYKLTPVLNPNRFLTYEERMAIGKRVDNRKELLKETLVWAISKSDTIEALKIRMEKQGYQVDLGKGIAFTDKKQVRFKGSQVGYSRANITAQLNRQRGIAEQQKQEQVTWRQPAKAEKLIRKQSKGRSI